MWHCYIFYTHLFNSMAKVSASHQVVQQTFLGPRLISFIPFNFSEDYQTHETHAARVKTGLIYLINSSFIDRSFSLSIEANFKHFSCDTELFMDELLYLASNV